MVSGIAGINYRIQKANRTDGRVQNLAVLIDKQTLLRANKASGIDKVTKEEYAVNLERNLENLENRLKEGINSLLETFKLPTPKIYVSLFYRKVTI